MFSSGIVPPAIVRQRGRTDTKLAGDEARDLRRDRLIMPEQAPGMTHQAELNSEAELIMGAPQGFGAKQR